MHEHANLDDRDDACLFTFNDLPVMQALGTYAEQPFLDNGGYQAVVA